MDRVYYIKTEKFSIMKSSIKKHKRQVKTRKVIYNTYGRGRYINKEKCLTNYFVKSGKMGKDVIGYSKEI